MGFNVSLDDILNMKSKLKKRPIPKVYEKPRYKSDSEDDYSDFTDSDSDDPDDNKLDKESYNESLV